MIAPAVPPLFDLPPARKGYAAPSERRAKLRAILMGLEAELDECIDIMGENAETDPTVAEYFERRACRVADRLQACRRRMESIG